MDRHIRPEAERNDRNVRTIIPKLTQLANSHTTWCADPVGEQDSYDNGYILRSAGRDVREWRTATAQEKVHMIESAFLRHDVDGFFVHPGNTDDRAKRHTVVRGSNDWLVEDSVSGERYRLLPDGSRANIGEGTRSIHQSAGGESRIRSESDIDTWFPTPPDRAAIRASGRFLPLERLVSA
jgi:hypothetical protein